MTTNREEEGEMKQKSDELIRLFVEEVKKYKQYLDSILSQAEAYQRDVERTRSIIKTYQNCLDWETHRTLANIEE